MQTRTRSNLNRELVGQGAANVVSGTIGGLPITGVIVRSSANVSSGARTRPRPSCTEWVLVFALPFAGLAEQIPMAALAGLLIVIGIQLVKLSHIQTARRTGELAVRRHGRGRGLYQPAPGCCHRTRTVDPADLWRVAHVKVSAERTRDDEWLVTIEEPAHSSACPDCTRRWPRSPQARVTMLMSVGFMDHAARDYINSWRNGHEAAGGRVCETQKPNLCSSCAEDCDSRVTDRERYALSAR